MKIYQILLVSAVFAAALAVSVRHDINVMNSNTGKGHAEYQSTKPTILETSSSRSIQDDLHVAQLKLNSNQIEGSDSRNNNKLAHEAQFYAQDNQVTGTPVPRDILREQAQFQNEDKGLPLTTDAAIHSQAKDRFEVSFQHQFDKKDFYTPEQRQFYGQPQQPFYGGQNGYKAGERIPNQQGLTLDHQSEDQYFNERQQMLNQQQFLNYHQQSGVPNQAYNGNQNQRQIYNVQAFGIENQHIKAKSEFQDVVARRTQFGSEAPLTQIHSRGIKTAVQLSAFNNREHPIVLPKSSSMHASSVVVSGLKNLPILPAMVYNTGSIPSTHAIAIGHDSTIYKGSASLRQHMQTPYVRYVYSHLL